MSLTKQDLKQIRFIVNDVVSDIREDVKLLKEDVQVLKADVSNLKSSIGRLETKFDTLDSRVGILESGSTSIMGMLRSQGERLTRMEENTAVCRRILERNELTEKSSHGKRIFRLESGVQKIPSVFKP